MFRHLVISVISLTALFSVNAQSKKPNIILIFADDLGYGDIGCYGQQKIETPNIDQLAKRGLRFTQFYSGSTVCAPARASLMTGLHTGHVSVRGNKGFEPEGQAPLPDTVITIANLLQDAGYTTAAFGKWGLGFITTPGDPNKKGFDQFYGYNCQSLAHNYYPDHLWNNHERIDLTANISEDSIYSADLIHQNAIKFLKADHRKPFFLYLPYTLPHGDVIAPRDSSYNHYIKKFNEEPLKVKPSNYSTKNRSFEPYPHAAFAAMVSRFDKYVGDIMASVEDKGIADNTLIIFTSDNGPHRENGGDPEFFNSNGIFRGIKRDLYEGGIRVPFIAYWKGVIQPGTSNRLAVLYDLHPTFTQLAGIKTSKPIDGISMLPTLMKKEIKHHDYLYWEFHENGGRQAVRWNNWKGVRLNVNKNALSPLELYNLDTDPSEQNNIATQHPTIVAKLSNIITQAHVHNIDWPLLPAERK
ncbi:MAG TPA: arylsulfatase [Flavitalea sp.]|nr:arylsulfatase [Flavitalea sp.]